MTIPVNTSPAYRQPNDRWSEVERSRVERAVAAMVIENRSALIDLDATAMAARAMALSKRITAYLVGILRPEWQSPPDEACPLRYDDEKLPPERRRELAAQLHSLLGPGFAEICSSDGRDGEAVWAAMLTDSVLSEIGQELLDSPVVYAADIARAVDHVSAYLRAVAATGRGQGEEALSSASSDILYLIVREACPYYLVSAPITEEVGWAPPAQVVSREQES